MVLSLLVTTALLGIRAQQNETISDKDMRIIDYQDFDYPAIAILAHVQGVVVVRLKLNDQGRVLSAEAISGADVLVRDCVANAKKWKFWPNAKKMAVIIYIFKMPQAACGSVSSFFMFQGVNSVTVTACPPTIEP